MAPFTFWRKQRKIPPSSISFAVLVFGLRLAAYLAVHRTGWRQGLRPLRWEVAAPDDEADIHWLYAALVPPLVQAANTPPGRPPRGLVYRKGDSFLGFVEVINGVQGIFLEPLIHPDVEDVSDLISELINHFPATPDGRYTRPSGRTSHGWSRFLSAVRAPIPDAMP